MKTSGRFLVWVTIVALWTLVVSGQSADSAEKEFKIDTWKQESGDFDVREFLKKYLKKHPTILKPDSSSQYFLEIVNPPPNIDYKILNVTPNPKIDFKGIIVNPPDTMPKMPKMLKIPACPKK